MRTLIEVPWFGPAVSAILVAAGVNLAYDAMKEWGGLGGAAAILGFFALLIIAFVYAYNVSEQRRRRRSATIMDKPRPKKYQGLIVLVSREETLREAIEYHRPQLKYCWLVTTPEMEETARKVQGQYRDVHFILRPVREKYDTRGCYELVRDIYQREAGRLGLDPYRIIADITGGTKPMTMGMILACIEGEYPLEHVPTEYDVDLRPKGPLPPIEIAVDLPPLRDRWRGEGEE
ncbi:MAG: hypothetical protein ACE5MB_09800 [Anaerolineae bacterium]